MVPNTSASEAAATRRVSTPQFTKVDCIARLAEMLHEQAEGPLGKIEFQVARMTS